jgi:dihydrodipicolinate synthase/N-acetylneuraminate lyase
LITNASIERTSSATQKKNPQDFLGVFDFLSGEDRTAIELFIAGVRGWEGGLRRQIGDVKPDQK